jgi:hypothetical protein
MTAQHKIPAISLEVPQATSTYDQLAINLGVPWIPSSLIIPWNDTQNSRKHSIYDYNFIVKDIT